MKSEQLVMTAGAAPRRAYRPLSTIYFPLSVIRYPLSVILFSLSSILYPLSSAFAAGAAKTEPVNENFPAWTGVEPKNYIAGRAIVPSDLRQRVTIVVEFQMENADKQLPLFAKWATVRLAKVGETAAAGESTDWMHADVHSKGILVFVNRGQGGKKCVEKWEEACKKLGKDSALGEASLYETPVYSGITFDGAPDAGGKYPFVYVMGPTGREPLFKSAVAEVKKGEPRDTIVKAKKDMGEFKPFFGTVAEPQFFKTLPAAIAKGKPLAPVQKSILAKVKSGNADEAKEAQILYDSLEQTKSDLILKMRMEAMQAPHCAIADFNVLGKYWPSAKKDVAEFIARYQKNAEIAGLGAMYSKMVTWSDPNFRPKKSEVKKIKADLAKFKKQLAPLKESKNITVQNAALLIDAELDTVSGAVESKVQ